MRPLRIGCLKGHQGWASYRNNVIFSNSLNLDSDKNITLSPFPGVHSLGADRYLWGLSRKEGAIDHQTINYNSFFSKMNFFQKLHLNTQLKRFQDNGHHIHSINRVICMTQWLQDCINLNFILYFHYRNIRYVWRGIKIIPRLKQFYSPGTTSCGLEIPEPATAYKIKFGKDVV